MGPVQLTSFSGVARWIDETVTAMLREAVAPMIVSTTEAIFPFVAVCLSISLLWYGWLIASGAIQMPVFAALRKVVAIGIIVNIAGAGGLYQDRIVDILLDLPAAMTSLLTDEPSTPSQLLDEAAANGAEISTRIQERAPSFLADGARGIAFVLVAIVVTLISGVLSALGTIVLTTVKVGMALCAILGPLVILGLLFERTKDFFTRWINQVLYYAIYAAFFAVIFTLVMGMFGVLQQGLLRASQASEINVFSMLTALVVFVMAAMAIFWQLSELVGSLTGGSGGGIRVPFVGKIG